MMPPVSTKSRIRLPATILICALMFGLFYAGIERLEIDTDVIRSLPAGDPVLADARAIIAGHPMQNQVVVDLAHPGGDPDLLVAAGRWVQDQMIASGLFAQVGLGDIRDSIPDLLQHVVTHLPMLFSENDIKTHLAPLLTPDAIGQSLKQTVAQLASLDSIGQAELVTLDPLGFRTVVLERLIHLTPAENVRIYKGFLLSPDQQHLLLLAKPRVSGTDTTHAKQLSQLMHDLADGLAHRFTSPAPPLKLTPYGAYRAALDNEQTAKQDVRLMIILATVGIALLMCVAFPRPYIGLLALLPAIAGTGAAIFIYSVLHPSISILTLGFGGAIISITVDHGIAYLLFLDRPRETTGRQAAREVWAIGLLATMTTVGAFTILAMSRFAILSQIGQFAALGIAFSFLFVHTLFPLMIPSLPPAKKERSHALQQALLRVARWGGRAKVWGGIALAALMMVFARPQFDVDFRAMNTVSAQTAAAEKSINRQWGHLAERVFLMTRAPDLKRLQARCDALLEIYEAAVARQTLSAAFSPSMIFPGTRRGQENFRAWKAFWNPDRIRQFKTNLLSASTALGFTPQAFDAFIGAVETPTYRNTEIPEPFFPLLGIVHRPDPVNGNAVWTHWSLLTPGTAYQAEAFYRQTTDRHTRLFDPRYFSLKLGQALRDTFLKMVVIIAGSVVVLVFVFFLDWKLSLVTLTPVVFAFVCTLGTLNLLGHPLGIPGLMLSIVVIGMGIDYALFFVRSHQRHQDDAHPSVGLIRLAVFLASTSTLVGFGALITAQHQLLKSAGMTCFIGIAFALVGAFGLLPPLLDRLFTTPALPPADSASRSGLSFSRSRVLRFYRHMEAAIRLRVWLRLRGDPVFKELDSMLAQPVSLLVFGIGYGELGLWLFDRFPHLRLTAVDPDAENVRITKRIIGQQAAVWHLSASMLADDNNEFDTVLLMDAFHHLSHMELVQMLKRMRTRLTLSGRLILRTPVNARDDSHRTRSWWFFGDLSRHLIGRSPRQRSIRQMQAIIGQAGFNLIDMQPSGNGRYGHWFLADAGTKPESDW